MSKSINVLALVRDDHRFIFLYDDNSVETMLTTLSQYASDPELEFTWYDAAMLAQRVRRMLEQQQFEEQMEDFPHAF
ncbi:MAG TPA: hypothetical protein EYG03_16720 [Planctomycetes bacterium]|nr:hypothetical protein [Planctomycetota bacterium]